MISSSGIGAAIARMLFEERRVTAGAIIARLHTGPVSQEDMKAARTEAKKIAKNPNIPDCAQQAAALGTSI